MNGRDAALAGVVVGGVLALVLATSEDVVWSWYIPLLTGCAFLGFLDAARFLRGKADFLSPGVLLGFVFIPLFLIAPIKQVAWDYWPFVPSLSTSIGWIDLWALLNFVGLICYRVSVGIRTKHHTQERSARSQFLWMPRSRGSLASAVLLFLVIGASAQAYIYGKFGGLTGFIETFTARQELGASAFDPFEGLGVPMILADSFKLVFAIGLIFYVRNNRFAQSALFFFALMLLLLVVCLVFGGLRGSRGATVFALFCAAGMYHLQIKRLRPLIIIIGVVCFSAFLGAYYWYKIAGTEGLQAITDASARDGMIESRRDAGKYVIARDLGRMDVQVLALKEVGSDTGPDYALGRTYVASVFAIIPRFILSWKPDQITKEKTDILYGKGSYIPDAPRQTTLVLGQVGESFVNFSYFGIFTFYIVLGLIVRRINTAIRTIHRDDLRLYLIPAVTLIPVLMVITDFNVIFQQAARYLLIPGVAVLLAARPARLVTPDRESRHVSAA